MRKQLHLVFQRPNHFAKSIYDNIAFALRRFGLKDKKLLDTIVTTSLLQAALWDQVKDDLNQSGMSLSGGQAQRLTLARAIALLPDILLLEQPASALDPISLSAVTHTLLYLKDKYTIILDTTKLQQAARIRHYTAFFYSGAALQ